MGPFQAYKLYLALKRHLTTKSYNFIKYKGSVKASFVDFEQRPDVFRWKKVADKRNPYLFVLGNLLAGKNWVGYMTDINALRVEKYLDAKTYFFSQEIKNLRNDFNSNFFVNDVDDRPHVLTLWDQGQISIETLAILEWLGKYSEYWAKNLRPTKENKQTILLISKYAIFFEGDDRDKYLALIRQRFNIPNPS